MPAAAEAMAAVSARRMRKVALVAVARKLAVALWKFLGRGELPEGATKADEKGAKGAAKAA